MIFRANRNETHLAVSPHPADPAIAAAAAIRKQILARKDFQEAVRKLLQVEGRPLPEVQVGNESSAPCVAKHSDMEQAWAGVCVFDIFSNEKVWGTISVVLDTNKRLSIQPLFIDID